MLSINSPVSPVAHRHSLLPLSPLAVMAALALAGPALAAPLQPADLALSMTASPGTVAALGQITYSLTVRNIATTTRVCAYDPDVRRLVCEMLPSSAGAVGVVLNNTLPAGAQFVSVVNDGTFSCSANGPVVNCGGGNIDPGEATTVTIKASAPNAGGAITNNAVVGFSQATPERSTTNNSAAATVTVQPPVNNNLPDLWANGTSAPNQFKSFQPVKFDLYIHNSGPQPANNITFRWYTNLPAALSSNFTINSNFQCTVLAGGFGARMEVLCTGGNIPAWQSAFMTVTLKTDSNFLPWGTPFTLFGQLDSTNSIAELNEGNNSFTIVAIVSP